MRLRRVLTFTVAILSLAWAGSVLGTPSTISYQGRLTSSGGTPVTDGSYAVTFSLWTDSVGGSMVWSELQNVQVTGGEGLFTCYLGSLQPLGGALITHADDDLHLQTSVSGEVLVPRQAIGAVPHAFSSSSVHSRVPGVGSLHIALVDDSMAVQTLEVDDDGDGIAEGRGIISVKSGTGSGSVSASSRLTGDADDDGVPETMAEAATSDKFAQVRGFKVEISGARSNFGSSCDSAGATSSIDRDTDDDGVPEGEVSQSVTPTTSSMAIKAKGTGADKDRWIRSTCGDSGAVTLMDVHEDGDGESESEISFVVLPTTSNVAIKVKGTGADKDRWVKSGCDDSSATQTLEVDDDGDGFAEAKAAVSSVSSLGGGGGGAASSAYARMSTDSDDDGIPENDATMMVTPTTSSVAIKWKGTGADANRTISSTCDGSSAVHRLSDDEDGDGVPDSEISQSVTPTTCGVAIKTKGTGADPNRVVSQATGQDAVMEVGTAGKRIGIYVNEVTGQSHITMIDQTLGTVDTSIIIDGATKRLGIGVSEPTNPIEHSSGAKLTAGGVWTNASDANAKENFEPVDGEELLEKLSELEITKWNYKADTETEHIGPTAQNFKETFGVGSDGKSISTIDPSGIALAAIKELHKKNQDLEAANRELQDQNAHLQKRMDDLARSVEKLAASR